MTETDVNKTKPAIVSHLERWDTDSPTLLFLQKIGTGTDDFVLRVISGTSWDCKEEEKIGVEETICRVSRTSKSSWFWWRQLKKIIIFLE